MKKAHFVHKMMDPRTLCGTLSLTLLGSEVEKVFHMKYVTAEGLKEDGFEVCEDCHNTIPLIVLDELNI